MKKMVDLMVVNAEQVVTCASDVPKRGEALGDAGTIPHGAVAITNGNIVAVGDTKELQATYSSKETIDATGKAVCPGFVDPHTHTIFGGDRVHEFEMRIRGASYMEIMAAGGGIVSTMRHTRDATVAELTHSASHRLDQMLQLGTTTTEIKSGYGLDLATEVKMLAVMAQLDETHVMNIVPTFLGAHTTPPEFKDDIEGYVDLVVGEIMPAFSHQYQQSTFATKNTPFFCDVFLEDHAFTVDQSRRILQAGLTYGMKPKIHVDQFNSMGGVEMAIGVGAVSADHLEVTNDADIERLANSDTIGVLMPAVNFNLGLPNFAQGRDMVDAGVAIALATDLNPGSAPCFSMPLTMAIATRYMKLSPAEAINAATINAAYAIGLGDKVGSLTAGKQADLLVLNAPDYRHLMYLLGNNLVETVIKNGRGERG